MVSQARLQAKLDELVARDRVPGMVAAVWRDGVLSTGAAGVANLNTGEPMTADTGYLTGSITKVWMTTVLMTFVEEGVIDLDAPIVRYAPEVQFGADAEVAKALTVRNLLNHSSGVDTGDLFVDSRPYPEGVEDYLGPISRAGRLTEPGTVSSYNNIGWIVAEIVLRRLTGATFHRLLRDRVIAPLGLARTVTSVREAILHRVAIGGFPGGDGGHEATPQFMYPDAWAAPGTTLITTVEDTIRFLRMHLAGGVAGDGRRILGAESVRAMQTPTSPNPTGPESGFGLGWMYDERDGRRVLSHGGGSPGGAAFALISPADNLALAAFANSGAALGALAELVGLALPDGPSPLAPPATAVRDDVDLAPFAGTYRRRAQRVDVIPDGDGLLVRLTPVAADLVGVTFPALTEVTEFRAAPTGADTLVSTDGSYTGNPLALAFSEPGPSGYNLLCMGYRLARRVTDLP